jgi:type VI secretion system protein ImpA
MILRGLAQSLSTGRTPESKIIRDTMDIEVLLTPISAASPCGEDLSFSPEFDQIAEMRRADDASLDQGEWVTPLKVADWPGAAQLCQHLLQQRSKDLRLAMWLTEAWALTRGHVGLSQGLQLCAALCERYWTPLHPQADGSDLEERIGNIRWVLQRVEVLASACRPAKDTSASTLLSALDAAQQSHRQLLAWQGVIDGHLGAEEGPGFVAAKEALAQAVHDMTRRAREAGLLAHPAPVGHNTSTNPATQAQDATPSSASMSGPLHSRAQALQQLRDVAAYFRQTEPHSPVTYLADKAVKWGDMPLHEWLRHVIKDDGAMARLQDLLGLDPQTDAPH